MCVRARVDTFDGFAGRQEDLEEVTLRTRARAREREREGERERERERGPAGETGELIVWIVLFIETLT